MYYIAFNGVVVTLSAALNGNKTRDKQVSFISRHKTGSISFSNRLLEDPRILHIAPEHPTTIRTDEMDQLMTYSHLFISCHACVSALNSFSDRRSSALRASFYICRLHLISSSPVYESFPLKDSSTSFYKCLCGIVILIFQMYK